MANITGREVYHRIKENIIQNHKELDIERIEEAYVLAEEAHRDQKRKSGEEYIIHPLEVAEILLSLRMDTDTIVAGILHDVVEDTFITISDIEYSFGKDVSMLIDGVTKLKNLPKKEGKQIENIRKMVVAMSEDVRVVIIKLADRLHNMRTLKYQTPEKQIEKSKETMDIYAPIAHRIGMGKIKSELEDISFYYLNKKGYQEIKFLVNTKKEERQRYIKKIIEIIEKELKNASIEAHVNGRTKHLYSIYRKMYEKNKQFKDLTDLTAIRILTKKEVECYAVLGLIHSIFTPIAGRFKDYIAVPKANGYQSIHTTVTGIDNQIIEIQIRTEEMHQIAEEGVAAHWMYKEKKSKDKNEKYYATIKKIVESSIEGASNNEPVETFAKEVTEHILKKTIFVFTPKGDVVELQAGSTVLDFAFQVHTQIGYRTIGAKVNDRIVTLDYVVENGDKIEILTSKTAKGPGNDWMNIVNNHSSKSKIRKWFKDIEFEMKSKEGEVLLNEEFNKKGLKFKDYEDDDKVLLYMKKFNVTSLAHLYYKFANNELTLEHFVAKFEKKEEVDIEQAIEEETAKTTQKIRENNQGIKISGSDNTLFNFAKCCAPLPGDEILGYVTRGRGIVIHRSDCNNIQKLLENESEREIEVYWDEKLLEKSNNKFQIYFTIKTVGRTGLMLDIMRLLNEYKIDLTGVNTKIIKENGEKLAIIHLGVLVKRREDYEKLSKNLLNMREILDIIRK
ncbi:RelA/SpoT family protein [Streptobacillus moniliformis]|uniref:RelA/SpoT family protein n=1 Tax=Streptobacillus moniliformis TaxID=34105 RepID=UPI0007E3019A|nr:bifunctional (p)ppGpp synthetase/guanosine-3',5'-bis(diphosphate) 3'-pyrophosphohydrolase [Streptobacillus moniliformis]